MFLEDETTLFQGGKSEATHEFLTLHYKILEVVGMVDACGVQSVSF